MKFLLIFSYTEDQYSLVEKSDLITKRNCEILFEFEEAEYIIARKVLRNLQLEHMHRDVLDSAAA